MKYRSKTIEIEATRWLRNGDHPLDYANDQQWPDDNGEEVVQVGDMKVRATTYTGALRKEKGWEGDIVRYFRHPDVAGTAICKDCKLPMHEHGWIDSTNTLNPSGCTVCPGDFVITERNDSTKYYPCKPDVFFDRYDRAQPDVLSKFLRPTSVETTIHSTDDDKIIFKTYDIGIGDGRSHVVQPDLLGDLLTRKGRSMSFSTCGIIGKVSRTFKRKNYAKP